MSASPTPAEVLRAPLTPLGHLFGAAARSAALAAVVIVGFIAIAVLIRRTAAGVDLNLGRLAIWSLGWGLLLFVVGFGVALFAFSRLFADRAFNVMGVLATFFGLAMLLVFFAQLGVEAYEWFTITPRLVEEQNRFLQARVDAIAADQTARLADLDVQLQRELERAPTDERKAELRRLFETQIKAETIEDMAKTAEEFRIERDLGVRKDTSPVGLFRYFMANGPSDLPQDAGIYPALVGSIIVSLITIAFAVPIGVGAAVYLEEYKSNNWLGRLIQININNLAGVPSVVYGILGGFVFVEGVFKPLKHQFDWMAARNAFGGGMTLALLTLPVVIVSAQEAIRAVPNSIRQGAYALGATQWQTIWRQVLPLAWPGILTGTILALSRAVGEAAPLVLFGATSFVNDAPGVFTSFTVLPMQIFGWADRPARLFEGQTIEIWRANAAMGCIVLLVTLLALNAIAIVMRNRAQRRVKW